MISNPIMLLFKVLLILNIAIGFFWAYAEGFTTFEPYSNLCTSILALIMFLKNDKKDDLTDNSSKIDLKNWVKVILGNCSAEDIERILTTVLFLILSPSFFYLFVYENPWYHDIAYRIWHTLILALYVPGFLTHLIVSFVISKLKD